MCLCRYRGLEHGNPAIGVSHIDWGSTDLLGTAQTDWGHPLNATSRTDWALRSIGNLSDELGSLRPTRASRTCWEPPRPRLGAYQTASGSADGLGPAVDLLGASQTK